MINVLKLIHFATLIGVINTCGGGQQSVERKPIIELDGDLDGNLNNIFVIFQFSFFYF